MSVSDYYSDNETISHISFTESDLEDLADLDHSFDTSNEEIDQTDDLVDRINNWLNITETHQREPTVEEMYMDIVTDILNYAIQFDIENLNLISFDMLNELRLEELDTYRENLLIRSDSIPRTLLIMVNHHLAYVNTRINQIIDSEFTN
jgi:hypothetical protein